MTDVNDRHQSRDKKIEKKNERGKPTATLPKGTKKNYDDVLGRWSK